MIATSICGAHRSSLDILSNGQDQRDPVGLDLIDQSGRLPKPGQRCLLGPEGIDAEVLSGPEYLLQMFTGDKRPSRGRLANSKGLSRSGSAR